MNAKELRQKTAAELKEELLKLRREQFNLRMAQASGQATKPDQFSRPNSIPSGGRHARFWASRKSP